MDRDEYERLINGLLVGARRYDLESIEDCYSLVRGLEQEGGTMIYGADGEFIGNGGLNIDNFNLAHKYNKTLRRYALDIVQDKGSSAALDLYYRTMLFDAPYNFDVYLRAIEFKQDEEKHFYSPRRHYLKKYVDAYQEVLDGKIKFLSISMIKRGGKSQMGINFVNLLSGRYPDRATLMEGTGEALVDSFYKGCLEYLDRASEYGYYDIFPSCKVVATNAEWRTINLNTKNRFPTIMCRSIDAKQIGLSEATNLLYLDDCVSGREEGRDREKLDWKWEKLSGDVIGRLIPGTPIVICGTRYSLYDPIGRLQDYAMKQNWPYKIIEEPALDEVTDTTNFEYYSPKLQRKVFTTEYFREQRELLTEEQWMSEFQQQPFEGKGQLFPAARLNRYFELPVDAEPDAIIAVCDTSEGRGDSTMLPVAYIYGDDVFIHDCVFSDAPPEHTKPECAKCLIENKVSTAIFESNAAGKYFARDVENLVKKGGGMCSFRTKFASANKATRIEFASDTILKHFYFKDKSLYSPSSEYGRMIKELTSYTRTGKVAHDDAPDGLAMLENEIRNFKTATITVTRRFF